MRFIITLIALLIERFFDWSHIRQWHWFNTFQKKVELRFAKLSHPLVFLLTILPPVLMVALVNHLLNGFVFGMLKLLFGIVVLMYCLGPQNFWAQAYICITSLQGTDSQAAAETLRGMGVTLSKDPQGFHRSFTEALFGEANRRVFAPLFWFVVLGPSGAVLYRCVDICRINSGAAATQVQRVLDWLPVRLLTFFFALGGHFVEVFKLWRHDVMTPPKANDALLAECGIAGLDVVQSKQLPEDGSAEKEAVALIDRAFVIGLVLLAISVLL